MQSLNIYIDEAGRGPLAGPLYVGLLLPLKPLTTKQVSLFKDSKQLSEKQREQCFAQIHSLQEKKKLIAFFAFATAKEIDTYGITNALHLAITRGIWSICQRKQGHPLTNKKTTYASLQTLLTHFQTDQKQQFHLFIDGNKDFGLQKTFPTLKITTIIDGDQKIKEISMASIIAKVSRDRVMNTLPAKYQKYAFSQHKGYGTALHREKIAQYGPSDIHRKLFLKALFPEHQVQRKLPEKF